MHAPLKTLLRRSWISLHSTRAKLRLQCRALHSPVDDAILGVAPMSSIRRPVVTAVVRNAEGKLLLVKRSNQVSTYQGRWGGVSGGVEGDESLLERALQELEEEVGLSADQLRLVCFGRPLPVDDGRRHFLVFPFLFELTDPAARLQLNWENTELDWLPASAVPHLEHVPLLPETIRRLLLPPYMQTHVQYLKADREHGAAELAAYVLQALAAAEGHEERTSPVDNHPAQAGAAAAIASSSGSGSNGGSSSSSSKPAVPPAAAAAVPGSKPVAGPTFEGCMEAYRNFCWQMAQARPSMAAVANAAAEALLQLEREVAARADAFEPTAGVARVALRDAVTKLSRQMQQQRQQTISNTAGVLRSGSRVLTTSLSSTVAKALIQAHQQALAAAASAGSGGAPAAAAAPADAAAAAGTLGGVPAPPPRPAAATAKAAALPSIDGDDSVCQAPSVDGDDWVDDPAFWPAISGIGRDCTSSSIMAALSQSRRASRRGGDAAAPGVSVVVCESRPLCEGVTMARRLAAAGLSVTLITDAQAGVFVEDVDLVLLGADAVTPAGVINKAGSKLLALAAKAAGVPVLAVTDSLKISPGPVSAVALPNTVLQQGEEEKDAAELMRAWGPEVAGPVLSAARQRRQQQQPTAGDAIGQKDAASSAAAEAASGGGGDEPAGAAADASSLGPGGSIEVRNVYFEAVPLQLVTGLVTDKGLLSQFEVTQFVKQRAKEYVQAFNLAVCADIVALE